MFEIRDGRPCFFQWDLNQKVIVHCNARQVHFCNGGSKSLVVDVKDGVADVPNILLQTAGKLQVYAYIIEDESTEKYTLCNMIFKVCQRSQPSDYVYTETEIRSYDELDERIKKLEEGGGPVELKLGHALYYDEQQRLSVKMASEGEEDNTLPITAAEVHTTVGNIEVLLGTI